MTSVHPPARCFGVASNQYDGMKRAEMPPEHPFGAMAPPALALLLLLCQRWTEVFGTTEIRVGVIIINGSNTPYDYGRTMAAIDIAVEQVNKEFLTLPDYKLVPIVTTYGPKCDASTAPGKCMLGLYYMRTQQVYTNRLFLNFDYI